MRLPGVFPAPRRRGAALLPRRSRMHDLTAVEVESVGGGILGAAVVAALTVYAVADIAYDFAKGVKEGYESKAN